MRELLSQARLRSYARAVSKADNRLHILAFYGAFAILALVVFGILPNHPF
jgi:hypothetical protein